MIAAYLALGHFAAAEKVLSDSAVVTTGTAGLLICTEYSRVGSSTWICPTSFVSTRIGVELVAVHGN